MNGLTVTPVGLPGAVVSAENANPLLLRKNHLSLSQVLLQPPAPASTRLLCTLSHKGSRHHRAGPICFLRADQGTSLRHHRAGLITEPHFATTGKIRSATSKLIKDLTSPPPGRSDLLADQDPQFATNGQIKYATTEHLHVPPPGNSCSH